MKFIYLITHRIAHYYKKNKCIFVLFVAGAIINAVMVCYLYGNLLPTIYNRHSTDARMYRTYQFSLSDEAAYRNETELLDSLIDTGLFEAVITRTWTQTSDESFNSVYYGSISLIILTGENRLPVGNEIIVPKLYSPYSTGDTIRINDEEYRVISEHGSNSYYVSYESFIKFRNNSVNTQFVDMVSFERYIENDDPVIKAFESIIPDAHFERPHGDFYDRINAAQGIIQILMSFLISMISFMFLFRFLLDSGIKENAVSRISGATKTKISIQVFFEGVLLTSVATIIGMLLHWILSPSVFNKLNIVDGIEYLLVDYFSILLFILTLTAFVDFVFTRKYSNISPNEAKCRRE